MGAMTMEDRIKQAKLSNPELSEEFIASILHGMDEAKAGLLYDLGSFRKDIEMKIIDYHILIAGGAIKEDRDYPDELIKKVKNWISLGWAPMGSAHITTSPNLMALHQTMVKYES